MTEEENSKRRTMLIVKVYPLGVLLIGVALNVFVFGVNSPAVALPSAECIFCPDDRCCSTGYQSYVADDDDRADAG